MTFVEAIKKAEPGDKLVLASLDGDEEPYAVYILSSDNEILFISGIELNFIDMNTNKWSVKK